MECLAPDSQRRGRSLVGRSIGPMEEGSERASIMSLASTAFGSALLVMPSVFASLGLLLGPVVLAVTGFATLLSLQLLVNGAYATGRDNYGGVVRESLGKSASFAADLILSLYGFLAACSCFLFLKQLIPAFMRNLGLPASFVPSQAWLLVVMAVVSAPLCLTRTVTALRYAAMLAVFSLVLSIVAILADMPAKHHELLANMGEELTGGFWWLPADRSWWFMEVPLNMAICSFALTCHVSVFPIKHELAVPVARRMQKVLARAVLLVTLIYGLIGAFCFLSLGPPCKEEVPEVAWPSCTPRNVLASPRFHGSVGTIAQGSMALTVLVCIPLNLGAGRRSLLRLLGCGAPPPAAQGCEAAVPSGPLQQEASAGSVSSSGHKELLGSSEPQYDSGARQEPFLRHVLITLLLLLLATCIGIAFNSIANIIAILGGFCVSSFGFVIPLAITVALRPVIATRPPSSRINAWLGVSPLGAATAGLVMVLCCLFCYASVVQAVLKATA